MLTYYQTKKIGRVAFGEYFWIVVFLSSILANLVEASAAKSSAAFEDDEFAEFEEFDDDVERFRTSSQQKSVKVEQEEKAPPPKPPNVDESDDDEIETPAAKNEPKSSSKRVDLVEDADDLEGIVEDEIEDEFSHLRDGDEFENFDRDKAAKKASSGGGAKTSSSGSGGQQQLKFTDVPAHLRNNWSNFQVEILMLFGLGLYMMNYAYGKTKNHRLATTWFEVHRDILQSNFEVVGDDGTTPDVQTNVLMKESDSSYSIWCTGRQGCQGLLVQLKLLKRQDLVSYLIQLVKPKYDRVIVKLTLNAEEADTFVLAFGNKKTVAKLAKEMNDLCQFCTEKKNAEKLGLPDDFVVYSEIGEAAASILDAKSLSVIKKFEEFIDFVHVSDQFSGVKPAEGDAQTKLPDISRVLIFSFNVPGKFSASEKDVEDMRPLLNLVFHCLDKLRRFRLSRESKVKADKNRLAAQESYLKQTHAQRQEAAQARREEKVRERKEKLLAEEDPEKQKRLEKMEQKRELKKKQPKVKQLKIKAG